MLGRQITVYDWFEIQEELCKIMGIPSDLFRDYHSIVGGEYKDFWHVCLADIIPDNMTNGSIVKMYQYYGEYYDDENETWKNKVLWAWNIFYQSVDTDEIDSGIYVEFNW